MDTRALTTEEIEQLEREEQAEQSQMRGAGVPSETGLPQPAVALTTEEIERLETAAEKSPADDQSFWQKIAPAILPTIGGGIMASAGGIAGSLTSPLTGPIGPAAGVIGGSALGSAMGEAANMALGITTQPASEEERMRRLKTAAVGGGVGEAVGRAAFGAAGRILSPLGKRVTPIGKIIKETIPEYFISDVTESSFGPNVFKALETIASQATLSGGRAYAKLKKSQLDATQAIVDAIKHQMGTPEAASSIGMAVQSAIHGSDDAFRAAASGLYSQVDQVAKGVGVDVTSLKPFAQQNLARLYKLPKQLRSSKEESLLKELAEYSDTISFQTAHDFRSRALKVIRTADDPHAGEYVALNKRLSAIIDDAMTDAAEQFDPTGTVYQTWRQANQFYKDGMEVFNTKFVKQLAKQQPEFVVDNIIKPKSVTQILNAKKAINDPQIWGNMQATFFEQLTDKATQQLAEADKLVGQKLLNQLRRYGEETIDAVFSRGTYARIDNLGRILSQLDRRQGVPGNIYTRVGAALAGGPIVGAVYYLGDPGQMGTAVVIGTVLVTPRLMTKLLLNPTAARYFTNGLRMPAGSKAGMTLISRAMGIVKAKQYSPDEPVEEEYNPGVMQEEVQE